MGSFFLTQNKKKQLSFIYENSVDEEQIFLVIDELFSKTTTNYYSKLIFEDYKRTRKK
jgi:hypothetical protein